MLKLSDLKIAVIGLGYVGLPLAVEFGKQLPVVGFDIQQKSIPELQYDAIVLAVAHDQIKQMTRGDIQTLGKSKHVKFDLNYELNQSESSLRL